MNAQKEMSSRAWVELILLALIWGGSFIAIHIALNEVPVLTSVLHRTVWAVLVLWGVVLARGIAIPRSWRVWFAFLAMGLMNNVIPFGLMAWGQLHIESGLTSILNASTAIFGVMVAALAFQDERLSPRKIIGLCLGFAGVTTTIGIQQLANLDLRSLAQLAVIGGAMSYAVAGAFARRSLSHLPAELAAAGMLTGASVILVPLVLIFDGVPTLALSGVTWAAIGYYALIATAIAYLLYFRVLAMAGSGNLLLVTLLIPPVTILLGALMLNEALAPRAYVGFALLASGLLVLDGRVWHRLKP